MDEEEAGISPEADARGLRYALWGTLAVLVVITLLTAIPGAPLRDPVTDKVIGDSPFMDSLIVIIMLVFFVAGYLYGRGAGTIKGGKRRDRDDHEVVGRLSPACSSCSSSSPSSSRTSTSEHRAGGGRQARRRARAV